MLTFHKDIYPKLKENFIDKGLVKLEYRNFPLDLAAFNAAKAAQCRANKGEEIYIFFMKIKVSGLRETQLKT